MRKRLHVILCIGAMALSLAGCGDEAKKSGKKPDTKPQTNTSTVNPAELMNPDGEDERITEEETGKTDDWKTGGSAELGYADVPAGWEEDRIENEENPSVYAVQYVDTGTMQGMISFLENQYGYEGQELTVDPALPVIETYVESYEQQGYTDLEIKDIILDGMHAEMCEGYIPQGSYTSYDYYTYVYVVYADGRLHTVVIEGNEDIIAGAKKRFEATYTLSDGDGGDMGNGGSGVAGSADWEDYQVVMDGDLYQLPCDFSELASAGWSISDDYAGDMIESDDFSSVMIERGGQSAWITLGNVYGAGAILVQDAQVVGITIDYELWGTDSYIAGGLCLGMSYDDVIAALGMPTDEYFDEEEGKEYYVMLVYEGAAYEEDFFSNIEITVSEGIVSEISVSHWQE